MKRRQKQLALLLLTLLLGSMVSAFLYSPAAAPSQSQTAIVALSEDDNSNINQGFLRSAAESQEEGTRSDDFVLVYSLQGYHSNNFRVQATQADGLRKLRPQKVCLYLLNSCITI